MDIEDIQRKVQFRQGSYMVTIPLQIIHALGMHKNQYVRFAVSNKKIIIKPVEAGFTKRDMSEADRDSAILDKYDRPLSEKKEVGDGAGEDAKYVDELARMLEQGRQETAADAAGDEDHGGGSSRSSGESRMEKLRMR